MTIEEEMNYLDNIENKRGYLTKIEEERYIELLKQKNSHLYMTDEEKLRFLKQHRMQTGLSDYPGIVPKECRNDKTIEEELHDLENIMIEHGYWTKDERERYEKLSQENMKEAFITDEQKLELLKAEANGTVTVLKDYPGITPAKYRIEKPLNEQIAELEERIAKNNANKNR